MIARLPRSTLFPYTTLFRSFYKNRLIRCYLGAARKQRQADRFTGFDPNDDIQLSEVNRSEEHTSELQSRQYLVCRLLLEKKKHNAHQRRQEKERTNEKHLCL